MTMMQKVQAKRSKKGFTLVELVIVIAILAILAAIAIPVITTTINSAKISTMESDTATLNMLIKEAINTYKAEITTTKWNGNTADKASVADICAENGIDDSTNYYKRTIGGKDYEMVWVAQGTSANDGSLKVGGGETTVTGTAISGGTMVTDLCSM